MANFSAKERLIASILSATPGLKKIVKKAYITVNALVYKKGYNHKILDGRISSICTPFCASESFGGYYDKSTINKKGDVVGQITALPTSKKPNPEIPIRICVMVAGEDSSKEVCQTSSYTWQQGARTHWLDEDKIAFNTFEDNRYKCEVYSIKEGKIIRKYDLPIQDSFNDSYYLSINYRRIMALRPDYGYRNLPLPSNDELKRVDNDGIWKVDFNTGDAKLIYSLADIDAIEPKEDFKESLQKVNHLMIKPDGGGFIFIHRWYKGGRRFDRLMYSDFKSLKVLADDNMVSHMCWIDDNTVFGYLRHENKNGFYFIDINTGQFTACDEMTDLGTGDGHPTAFGDWIAFDTYPDKSRMQHLYLYNRKTKEVLPLIELHHGIKYMGECRCDLHPRFSPSGREIFFDTVYDGSRHLCSIDVSKITNS